jgi:alpha-ketoglutarate-dependent taurine dioxygenase
MVKAIININESANRLLNILKAKYDLKDKSQAINKMAEQYEEEILEPELRPEYVDKIKKIQKHGKFKKYTSVKELRDEIENA